MSGFETIIDAGGWRQKLQDAEAFADRVYAAVIDCEPRAGGEAALLLTDDEALRKLNRQFRNKDAPTNVLSFPSGETAPAFIGDIAIALETCAREAREKGVDFADHAAHLIAHGLLHLVGHDHIEPQEAENMEAIEIRVLAALGVSNPYETEELEV